MNRTLAAALFLVTFTAAPAAAVTIQLDPSLNSQTFPTGVSDFKAGATDVIGIGIHTNGSNGPIRSFTAFDLSSLPNSPYLQITSATFSFNTQTNAGNIPNSLVMASLNTPLAMTDPGLSWTSINGTNNWTTPGGNIGSVLGTLSAPWADNTAYAFGSTPNFVQAVQNAYNANIPLQVLLYMPGQEAAFPTPSTAGGFIRIHARNNPTLGGTLTLNYDIVIPPVPAPEPGTALLASLGIVFLGMRRRRTQS